MAQDIISFDDLFDFNSDAPLDKGLEGIERLDKAYKAFANNLDRQNDDVRKSLSSLKSEFTELEKTLLAINVATEKGRAQATAAASSVNSQTEAYSKLKAQQQQLVDKIKALSAAQRDLKKAYDLLSKTQEAQAARAKKEAAGTDAASKAKERKAKAEIAIAEQAGKIELAIAEKTAKAKLAIAEREAKHKIDVLSQTSKAAERAAIREENAEERRAKSATNAADREAQKQLAIDQKYRTARIAIVERTAKANIAIREREAKASIAIREREEKHDLDAHAREVRAAEAAAAKQVAADAKVAAAKRARGGTGSINDISGQRDDAVSMYKRMGTNTPDFVKKDQLDNINRLTRELDQAQAAMLLARKGAIVARDSYAGLVQENARLVKQLREMPGAFNSATGEINRHNKAAVELSNKYRQNTDALKNFDRQLGLNQRNVGNYGGTLGAAGNSLKQFALGLAGQFAGMYALAEATRVAFTSNLALSDSQVAVQKTVGVTKAEVDALAESFKSLDSRTDLAGLFDIARIGGQFGVAERDIESFTKSANKAAVALSDEFKGGVEEVATELYTLRGLFEDTKELSPAEAIERIGSAVNALGAAGAATGPVIAEFAKRIGQLGEMGPGIGDALGLGAALQELGFSAEIASGGYTNLVIQLDKNAAKVSKAYGMTEKAFRGMLKQDPTELILNMAESMQGMENSTEILASWGIQSQESIKVFNSLGSAADRVREQMKNSNRELEKNTSITNEFNLANNSAAASWDKLKRSLLEPFVSGAFGAGIQTLIDKVQSYLDLWRSVESNAGRTAQVAVTQAEAYARQANSLDGLVAEYENLQAQSTLTAQQQKDLLEISVKINTLVGAGTLALNEETGAYELNIDKVIEKQKALRDLAKVEGASAQTAVDALKEEEKRLQESINLTKAELDIVREEVSAVKKPNVTGNAAADALLRLAGDPRFKAYADAQDRLAKKEEELVKLGEELNDLNVRRKAIMGTMATSINKVEDAYKTMTPWAQKANGAFQFATWEGKKKNPLDAPDAEVEKSGGAASKAADEMKRLADLAAEARHQLILLNQEMKVEQAEYRLEDTDPGLIEDRLLAEKKLYDERRKMAEKEAAWKLSHVTAGSKAEEMIRRDLAKTLESIEVNRGTSYEKEMVEIKRVYDEQAELARLNAEEKKKHNEAGADGITLINRQLQRDLENIERKRIQAQEDTLNTMINNEREAAEKKRLIWAKETKADREERKETAKWYTEMSQQTSLSQQAQFEKDQYIAENVENKKRELWQQSFELAATLSNSLFEVRLMNMQAEYDRMAHMKEQELAAAGDNKELAFQIEERYRKKELKLRQKMARAEKKQAMFDIIMNTAGAVMRALNTFPGPPYTIPFALMAGAMGAAQLAVAASAPIPQFYRGVKSSPEGPARVAETGPELAVSPEGKLTYYERPQVAMMEKGTEVKTASQTRTILKATERVYNNNHTNTLVESFGASQRLILAQKEVNSKGNDRMVSEFRKYAADVADAINRQSRLIVNPDGSTTKSNGRVWNEYVNQKYYRK